jgi:hypothetical protein
MSFWNYVISGVGLVFGLLIVGTFVYFLWSYYLPLLKTTFKPILMKIKAYRNSQYRFWADITFTSIKNGMTEEEIIVMLGSQELNEDDINAIFDIVNAKLKGGNE